MSATAPIYDWAGFDFETRQVHAGEYKDLNSGLRVPPIALSAGYVFEDFEDGVARFSGQPWRNSASIDRVEHSSLSPDEPAPIYSRQGNPTNSVAEERLASLEGGSAAVAVSSGQAAISAAIFALAGQGDHIVSTASIYGGTRILFGRSVKRFGISVDYVWDSLDDDEWERAIRPETKAIYTESIPNPRNDVVDLKRIAEVAARYNLPVIVDNTVGTPALIRPFEHGANIVVHSTTKFLTGNGAAVGGAVVDGGNFDWEAAERAGRSYPLITASPRPGLGSMLERFGRGAYARATRESVVNDIGPSLSPFNGFLLHQGIETLSLRMERHVETSQRLAAWLEQQPEVESVDYAGLPSHPLFALAARDYGTSIPRGAAASIASAASAASTASTASTAQGIAPTHTQGVTAYANTGSVFGLTVRGGREGARAFFNGVRIFSRMTGIGDTRSMLLHPLSSTHTTFAPEINERLGITEGLLRLSVGLESADDLITDLRHALDRVAAL